MKQVIRLFNIGLLAVALPTWAGDNLWADVTANAKKAQQLAAGDIDLVLSASKDGKAPPARHFRLHLSQWDQGKPVYTSVEIDPQPGAPKANGAASVELIKSFAKMGDVLLEADAKVARADAQPLDGKTLTAFTRREEGIGRKMVATIWVDPATACPQRIDTDLHISLYVDGKMKTSYMLDPQGRCVPHQLEGDFAIIVPFKGMKVKMTQISSNWVAQPARQ